MAAENELYARINNGDLLYSKALKDFLLAFTNEKINYEIPQNISNEELKNLKKEQNDKKNNVCIQALHDIIDVWNRQGFIGNPKDLFKVVTEQKIDKNITDSYSNKEHKKILNNMLNYIYDKDTISGWGDKNSAPLIEALGSLYKQINPEKNVYLFAFDIQNMGGVNLANAEQLGGDTNGWAECDKAMAIGLNIYKQTINEELKGKGNASFYRSGGDEFGAVIQGDISKKELKNARKKAWEKAEKFFNYANVNDIDHPKYLDGKFKGMSIAVGITEIDNSEPFVIKEKVEFNLLANKIINDSLRNGVIPIIEIDYLAEKMRSEGLKEDEISLKISGAINRAENQARENRELSNPDEAIAQRLDTLPDEYRPYYPGRIMPKTSPISTTKDNDDRRGRFEKSSYTVNGNIIRNMQLSGSDVNNFSYGFAEGLTRLYTARDYASSAFPTKMLAADAQRYYFDALDNQNETKSLQSAKLLYVECGNLQGLNETFGHEPANVILEHQTQIIRDSLTEFGIKNDDAIYAISGGASCVLLPSMVTSKNKNIQIPVDELFITKIKNTIKTKVENEINKRPIVDYLSERGIPTKYHENSQVQGYIRLADETPIFDEETEKKLTFKDIPHPRRKSVKGISVVYSDFHPVINSKNFIKEVIKDFQSASRVKQDIDEDENKRYLQLHKIIKERNLKEI